MHRLELKNQVYLDVAKTISKLSKDENTQVGAVIVSIKGEPISWGYNGTLPGMDDNDIPHSRDKKQLVYIEDFKFKIFESDKYPFMEHAEENALDFGDKSKMVNATLYVTHMPCAKCARKIVKCGIARVVVADNPTIDGSSVGCDDDFTKFWFAQRGVSLYIGDKKINISKPTTQSVAVLTSENVFDF